MNVSLFLPHTSLARCQSLDWTSNSSSRLGLAKHRLPIDFIVTWSQRTNSRDPLQWERKKKNGVTSQTWSLTKPLWECRGGMLTAALAVSRKNGLCWFIHVPNLSWPITSSDNSWPDRKMEFVTIAPFVPGWIRDARFRANNLINKE